MAGFFISSSPVEIFTGNNQPQNEKYERPGNTPEELKIKYFKISKI